MNRIILASLVALISLTTVSCKKDNSDKCYLSYTNIGDAYYKVSKVTKNGSDVTTTYLTPCQQTARYELYRGKTANFVPAVETSATCKIEGSGTWSLDVTKKTVSINITTATSDPIIVKDASVVSWDCNSLVLSQMNGGSEYHLTFTKL